MKRFFCIILSMVSFILFGGSYMQVQSEENPLIDTVYASSLNDTSNSPKGGLIIETVEQNIDYAYKIEDYYSQQHDVPGYLSSYTCGITAGGVAIGYYDKLYDELIPNHTGKMFMGKYLWAPQGDEIDLVYDKLFDSMNATNEGVTINGYINGIKSYVSEKGRTASFANVMSSPNKLDIAEYKSALKNGKLLSIFLDGFSIISFGGFVSSGNHDKILIDVAQGAHIMIAYGYHEISYYNSNNQCFRQDNYLLIATGFSAPRLGMVKLNQYCVIDDCYITGIY